MYNNYFSEIKVTITLHKAADNKIITATKPEDSNTYRIKIEYLELLVKRLILNPNLQLQIDNIWNDKPILMAYNRYTCI